MKVAVFGLGYVGSVTAAGLAAAGHEVVGVDLDPIKVTQIATGRSPVLEPGLEDLIRAGVETRMLSATSSAELALEGADASLICVGTPGSTHGEPQLDCLDRALDQVRAAMDVATPPATGHHSVVIRSTVPPGTGATHVDPVFADVPAGWSIGTAMCPEFLREGTAVVDFYTPPFLVMGTDDEAALETLRQLFAFLLPTIGAEGGHHVSVETAEALKYACNAFHATKVSFTNELARIFRGYGVDAREVMEVFCADEKLNLAPAYLRPGFAYGGSCLPKDVRALQHLARQLGVDAPLLAGTAQSNELVVRNVVERVIDTGARRVALLGLSFKADIDDLRESPSVELAERLLGKGFAVRIFDPALNTERLTGANLSYVQERLPHLNCLLARDAVSALAGAEVALVGDAGPSAGQALLATRPPLILDLHGRLGPEVEALPGYEGVGW